MKYVSEANYYEASDLSTGEPVTVRSIDVSTLGAVGIGLEHLAADKLRRKVENEQKIVGKLRELRHPGLFHILDSGFDDPIYYHVYPPFVFENLQSRIEQGLERKPALNFMLETAQTLAFLHENGIVHCDVSAENLVLVENHVKIIEFSIANFEPAEGSPGNPFYMSPEAIMGSTPEPARDVWALAVTMTYALTGQLPFGSFETALPQGVPLLFQSIFQDPPRLETSPELAQLLLQMLEKDAAKRIPMRDVISALERDVNL